MVKRHLPIGFMTGVLRTRLMTSLSRSSSISLSAACFSMLICLEANRYALVSYIFLSSSNSMGGTSIDRPLTELLNMSLYYLMRAWSISCSAGASDWYRYHSSPTRSFSIYQCHSVPRRSLRRRQFLESGSYVDLVTPTSVSSYVGLCSLSVMALIWAYSVFMSPTYAKCFAGAPFRNASLYAFVLSCKSSIPHSYPLPSLCT